MRRLFISLILAMMLLMAVAGSALADQAGPCNDKNGDGSPSGQEYAKHHIVPSATGLTQASLDASA